MIWLDEIGHDFGELMQGSDVSFTFHVTNFGDQPLVFDPIKTSCGCDVATTPYDPIPPGGTAEFTYRYDSNRIGGLHKSFRVKTNAVNDPEIYFVMKGNILPKPAEPDYLAPPMPEMTSAGD